MPGLQEKLNLLRGLLDGEAAYAGPFGVTVDVTRRCNLRCIGCSAHSPLLNPKTPYDPSVYDFDAGMFEELCRELGTMGARVLVFCGDGEPLLHPRLFDLIGLAKGSGFRTVLITNGTLIDETKAAALAESGLDLLRVSLWASTPEEFEKNYPGTDPGMLNGVRNGLRLAASAKKARHGTKPEIMLHVVINRHNFRSVPSFAELALTEGANAISFSPSHTASGQLSSLGLSPEDERAALASLAAVKKRLRSSGLKHNIDEMFMRYSIGEDARRKSPCYTPWLQLRIKVDGTVQPCNPCQRPMGNLKNRSMREIWNGPEYRAFRREILSPAGSPLIDESCDCSYCCFVLEHLRIHRYFRWLRPLRRILES